MILKIFILLLLLLVLYCLGSGVFYLVRQKPGEKSLVRALTWRIILSFCLFLFLLFAYFMGWISPHGIT